MPMIAPLSRMGAAAVWYQKSIIRPSIPRGIRTVGSCAASPVRTLAAICSKYPRSSGTAEQPGLRSVGGIVETAITVHEEQERAVLTVAPCKPLKGHAMQKGRRQGATCARITV